MNAVEYIGSFSRYGKKVENLDRIKALMKAVGNPEKKLKFIHIAGTNGKGSMAQMFNEILVSSGLTVGLFTSPYIVEYSDRIKVNSKNISYESLEKLVDGLKPILENHPMRNEFSQFEITQAVALTYFVKEKCDIVVMEAGLGGLLDSTNIIEKPIVSVIGSVDFDHTAILGDTLEKIAFQKAGIIKQGCPCVLSGGNKPEVVATVRETAIEKRSLLNIPILTCCTVSEHSIRGSKFVYRGREYELSMPGLHQISNALTVIDAMKFVRESFEISDESIGEGLKKAVLYGRVEVVGESPLTILDGAHNPDGLRALSAELKNLGDMEITAVIGMHRDKNALDGVKCLVPYVEEFTAVSGFSPQDYPACELAEIISKAGGTAKSGEADIMAEIRRARDKNKSGAVVICGSLYLVAYVKKMLDNSGF